MTRTDINDLDKRLALQEQKIDTVVDDICEIKRDMKDHVQKSTQNSEKLNSKMDMVIWAIVVGMAGLIVKTLFF